MATQSPRENSPSTRARPRPAGGSCRGGALSGGAYLDENGESIAVATPGLDGRQTLVASIDVLDRALQDLKSPAVAPDAASSSEDYEPKLCPDPAPEPKTTTSENSIRYQEYVSKLPYGLAINVGGVRFDGCDTATGDLLEAKADIDFMFNDDGEIFGWVDEKNNPKDQMERQADAALHAGRIVIWHAQTEKGFRALNEIAGGLGYGNLSVVYDPN